MPRQTWIVRQQAVGQSTLDPEERRVGFGIGIDLPFDPGEIGEIAEQIAGAQYAVDGHPAVAVVPADRYRSVLHQPETLSRTALLLD